MIRSSYNIKDQKSRLRLESCIDAAHSFKSRFPGSGGAKVEPCRFATRYQSAMLRAHYFCSVHRLSTIKFTQNEHNAGINLLARAL
jgi:hypothetical protein